MKSEGGLRRIPLPFPARRDWHWRWCQPAYSRATRMHRITGYVARYTGDDPSDKFGVGLGSAAAACGIYGDFIMPGFLSRMGAQRCPACCKAVGIKGGRGAPYNAGVDEPGCEGPWPP